MACWMRRQPPEGGMNVDATATMFLTGRYSSGSVVNSSG
jgi:hypothetical protein